MTIEEAIANARKKAKEIRENIIDGDNLEPYESYCITMADKSAEEHEQLAEWLEELKDIKSDGFTDDLLNMGFTKGYNKAIDDCKELTFREVVYYDSLNDRTEFRELAEQLKADDTNE